MALCAVSRCLLCAAVHHICVAAVDLRAFWHLPRHRHSNYFQPALLQFLRLCSKVVHGL